MLIKCLINNCINDVLLSSLTFNKKGSISLSLCMFIIE